MIALFIRQDVTQLCTRFHFLSLLYGERYHTSFFIEPKYLKVFLEDGEVPIDNSATERAIRPFTIGRANWHIIDTIHGAQSSAVIYSLVETAKANKLKIYEYLKHLLTEIPKHMDNTSLDFLEDLLPWSKNLPEECRKKI